MNKKRLSKSFQAKILVSTMVLFVMFCVVSTYSWYQNFTAEATETAVDNISSLMEVLNNNFELTLKDIDYVTALISNKVTTNMNNCVIDYLLTDEADRTELVKNRREVQDYLASMCSFKSYLQGMAIYNFNGRVVTYGITTPVTEITEQSWYPTVLSKDFELLFVPPHYSSKTINSPKSSQVFSIVRPIVNNDDVIGFVVADIKSSLLDDMFNINNINGYTIYVVDNATGEVIYQPENTTEAPVDAVISNFSNLSGERGYYFNKTNGKEYLVVYEASDFTPWTVAGIVPRRVIISDFVTVRNKMMGLVGIYSVIFILLTLMLTNFVTKDLRRLSASVALIDSENMDLNLKISSKDEVGFLYQQIQSMLARIESLITNIRKTEKEKRKSEIKMLQAQINPHFLYNSLNTIRILASMQGIANIQTVCNALSNMLHLNLDTRKFISISEETQYLLNYLQLQEYRYAGKFVYHFSVDDTVKDYMIPKLIIQPIVENALQHGIAPLEGSGALQILAYQEEQHLKIVVKDNGKSFDKALIAEQHYCGTESNHIGLYNICSRLKLLFGEEGDLLIYSEPGMYTIVEVVLPVILNGDEVTYD